MKVEYIIEKNGDAFYLYSIVQTNFGGPAKNFIRMSATKRELERTIQKLRANFISKNDAEKDLNLITESL